MQIAEKCRKISRAPTRHIRKFSIFLHAAPVVATDYREPSSPTYRYMPRKNSGIRGLSLRTEGALGNAVFEGHIRYPNGLKALYNRGFLIRPAKKMLKNLHMCDFCSNFAADLCEGAVVGLEP